jgi:hypothetical protein
VKGALGGVLALGLSAAAWALINSALLRSAFFTPLQAAAGVAAGALIGFLGSALSVGRHLKGV